MVPRGYPSPTPRTPLRLAFANFAISGTQRATIAKELASLILALVDANANTRDPAAQAALVRAAAHAKLIAAASDPQNY
jgi:hypothetical protein